MAEPRDFQRQDGGQKRARFVTGEHPVRAGLGAAGKRVLKRAALSEHNCTPDELRRSRPKEYERLLKRLGLW